MTFSEPLRFAPWLRPMPWGGTALAPLLNLPTGPDPIGEAWLFSDHRLHQSHVTDGPWQGHSLRDLIQQNGDQLLGGNHDRFPLLIKLLDARENLSVQVHPDDAAAAAWAPLEGGKTEAWTVLAREPEGALYVGLKRGMDKTVLARELMTGNAVSCLQRYEPVPGETYFVPAGTVHALGLGVLALEVQQTSDATFRLYDWGRVGPDGKPRALHMEAGLACANAAPSGAGLQSPTIQTDGRTLLVRSDFFEVFRLPADREIQVIAPALLFPWQGHATWNTHSRLNPGAVYLLPYSMKNLTIFTSPDAILFEIRWK